MIPLVPLSPSAPVPLPPGAIARSIRTSLAAILDESLPVEKSVALLTVISLDDIKVVAAARVGAHWKFAAEGSRTWDGELQGRVVIAGSW